MSLITDQQFKEAVAVFQRLRKEGYLQSHCLRGAMDYAIRAYVETAHSPLTDSTKPRRSAALDELGALPANEVTE